MKGRIFLLVQLLHLAVTLSKSSPQPSASNLLPKTCGVSLQHSSIVSGTQTRLGTYPWVAALGYKNAVTNKIEFQCGGSVISERYVLTAAHCFGNKQPDIVRLGEWDLSTDLDCETTGTGFDVCAPEPAHDLLYKEIITHPDYNTRGQISDDIALIRLATPINFERNGLIQPICLPKRNFNVQAAVSQSPAVATSWGSIYNILQHVVLPYTDMKSCNVTYSGRLLDKQMCFGGVGGDICDGLGGSPLMVSDSSGSYTQIGIVSFGPAQCSVNVVPNVYTSVAKYRDWIEQNLKQ